MRTREISNARHSFSDAMFSIVLQGSGLMCVQNRNDMNWLVDKHGYFLLLSLSLTLGMNGCLNMYVL